MRAPVSVRVLASCDPQQADIQEYSLPLTPLGARFRTTAGAAVSSRAHPGFLQAAPHDGAVDVTGGHAARRAAEVSGLRGAAGDGHVAAGGRAGSGVAHEQLARARIAIVGARRRTAGRRIAGLAHAEHTVAAVGPAVRVGGHRAARWTAPVAAATGRDADVAAGARAAQDG